MNKMNANNSTDFENYIIVKFDYFSKDFTENSF